MGEFSIWHLIVIALIIAFFIWLFALARRLGKNKAPDAIGGWLALLIVGLILMGPLTGATRMANDIGAAESQYPQLLTIAKWGEYKMWSWGVLIATCVVTIYAGYLLATSRNISAVRFAIAALWAGPASGLVVGLVLPAALFGRADVDNEFWSGMIASAIVAFIWTLYLTSSTRVKARYLPGAK